MKLLAATLKNGDGVLFVDGNHGVEITSNNGVTAQVVNVTVAHPKSK